MKTLVILQYAGQCHEKTRGQDYELATTRQDYELATTPYRARLKAFISYQDYHMCYPDRVEGSHFVPGLPHCVIEPPRPSSSAHTTWSSMSMAESRAQLPRALRSSSTAHAGASAHSEPPASSPLLVV